MSVAERAARPKPDAGGNKATCKWPLNSALRWRQEPIGSRNVDARTSSRLLITPATATSAWPWGCTHGCHGLPLLTVGASGRSGRRVVQAGDSAAHRHSCHRHSCARRRRHPAGGRTAAAMAAADPATTVPTTRRTALAHRKPPPRPDPEPCD